MNNCPMFHVQKRTLLALAGVVWAAAGINVVRMGLIAYAHIGGVSALRVVLSLVVFGAFGAMFYKITITHTARIRSYGEHTKSFWHFFDAKSYMIMAVMMGGGIWLRTAGVVSEVFIAVFYTGLGCALTLAGLLFWWMYARYSHNNDRFTM